MAAARLGPSAAIKRIRASKATLKTSKDVGGKQRDMLQYRKTTVKAARAALTKAINKNVFVQNTLDGTATPKAKALHEGVRNMAYTRLGDILSDEELAKISAMEPTKLQALYDNDRFVFDVYFSYGGINELQGAYEAAEGKADDVRFLIQQYERAFGEIRV